MQPGWCQPVRQEFVENECEALPGVAYPGVRDNRSTLNTKTGYDDDNWNGQHCSGAVPNRQWYVPAWNSKPVHCWNFARLHLLSGDICSLSQGAASICLLASLCRNARPISTKFDGKVAHRPQKKPLDVGGNPGHITFGLGCGRMRVLVRGGVTTVLHIGGCVTGICLMTVGSSRILRHPPCQLKP